MLRRKADRDADHGSDLKRDRDCHPDGNRDKNCDADRDGEHRSISDSDRDGDSDRNGDAHSKSDLHSDCNGYEYLPHLRRQPARQSSTIPVASLALRVRTVFPPTNKPIWISTGVTAVGSQLEVLTDGIHTGNNLWYATPVNIQAFTTTFTFQADCSANPTFCGQGLGFMIIGNDASNNFYKVCPSQPPSATCGYNYTGFAGPYLSWAQNCNAVDNNNCLAINEAIVKFDLYGLTGSGQNLTNYCQASTVIGGTYPQNFNSSTANTNCGGLDLDMAGSSINMQSGDVFTVALTYNGSKLFESVTETLQARITRTPIQESICRPFLVLIRLSSDLGGATG